MGTLVAEIRTSTYGWERRITRKDI